MLMAWNDSSNDKYILPENVPANEFLNFEGKKFSKSRGWGIDVEQFLEIFPADSLRYTLAANLPENKDTDFFWKEFQAKNNSELADILGNFINRTFIFANKHFEEKVPARGELDKIDSEMIAVLSEAPKKIGKLIDNYKIKDAVFEMMSLARAGNKYFNDSEPWVSVKTNKAKTATTINICLQTIRTLAEVFSPVIPFSTDKIFKMLNVEPSIWNENGIEEFEVGHQLNKSEILFVKIEDKTIDAEVLKWSNPANLEEEIEEQVPEITFDDFMKVDLKVAEIVAAENVPKSKKLLKLKVKVGKKERQVVAGIAQSYKAEELIGKKVVFVANLKPAKLFGIESQGMVLAIEDESGKLNVVEVNKSLNSGLKVR
jgi:methionyl-tRNA synthetase